MSTQTFPKYIIFSDDENLREGSALVHIGSGEYYRDAGNWYVKTGFDESDRLVGMNNDKADHVSHLNGIPVLEVSEDEWRKSNGRYV